MSEPKLIPLAGQIVDICTTKIGKEEVNLFKEYTDFKYWEYTVLWDGKWATFGSFGDALAFYGEKVKALVKE